MTISPVEFQRAFVEAIKECRRTGETLTLESLCGITEEERAWARFAMTTLSQLKFEELDLLLNEDEAYFSMIMRHADLIRPGDIKKFHGCSLSEIQRIFYYRTDGWDICFAIRLTKAEYLSLKQRWEEVTPRVLHRLIMDSTLVLPPGRVTRAGMLSTQA